MRFSRGTYAFIATLGGSSMMRLPSIRALHPTVVPTMMMRHSTRVFLSSSSSSFQAPEPPTSKAQSIFPDVDLTASITESARQRNSDPNAVFLVNGSSRGIGLQMVKSLVERTQGTIVACCRTPDDPTSPLQQYLQSLSPTLQERIHTVPLDLQNQTSIDALGDYLKTTTTMHSNNRLDGLFNVAGVLGDGSTTPGPERSLARLERQWLEHTLQVNLVGHVMLIQALQRLLKSNIQKEDRPTSVIVNLSARVGSIADNELGGWYSYRMSKAALNQATRTMAHELKRQGTCAIAVHPGTTDTDLSKPFQKNVRAEKLFPVDFTVDQILDVVDRIDDTHTGGLYDWAGKAIPF
ncbi:Uncharacterized oxidoreductase C663 [Seminavis robusta]|uniref:Uncharacterized oxidoreductase C663 n=1 Tax=Seminavis robusta TaxID=568900 RepID=A0A9N8E6Q1_9STRA|nr:Uncharacterized oxidoreductase C663 [Seminavis robusta]|eukprot:Sro720_g192660.1 Uncharacterized oxidoreductase C663 (351) ;mRNA; f:37679-38731